MTTTMPTQKTLAMHHITKAISDHLTTINMNEHKTDNGKNGTKATNDNDNQ